MAQPGGSAPEKAAEPVAEAAFDVVPSGEALRIARSWLPPVSDSEEDEFGAANAAPARPPRLGLGAAPPRPLSAASEPLERRLRRSLGAGRAARLAREEAEAEDIAYERGAEAAAAEQDGDCRSRAVLIARPPAAAARGGGGGRGATGQLGAQPQPPLQPPQSRRARKRLRELEAARRRA